MNGRNQALAAWHGTSNRRVPWRDTSEPWQILVAEVMTQQTQLVRVVPALELFMTRYPSPGRLARAPLGEVLQVWGGLGYQRRVVNLRRAAATIDGSGWPRDVDGLRRLPGIGPYTAAAVACFAFGAPVPAVDTNLRRVISRWVGEPLRGAALADRAQDLLDHERPAAWNQAIMDLGATLCRPHVPDCPSCPVSRWCTDPTVYVPPRRQTRFEGSVRQARAAVLTLLATDGTASADTLGDRLDLDPERVGEAVAALAAEGVVVSKGDEVSLAD